MINMHGKMTLYGNKCQIPWQISVSLFVIKYHEEYVYWVQHSYFTYMFDHFFS